MARYSSMSAEELVRACAESNDGAAWEEFVARFQRPIGLSILRTARPWGDVPSQLIDDLIQETYLKLCSNRCQLLLEFARQHPEAVVGYLKTIAANVAHDYFRSRYAQKRGAGQPQQSLDEIDSTAGTEGLDSAGAMDRHVLLKQIDACLGGCTTGPDQERDRMIFWLYYQQGMSAKDIAALPTIELTAKGVESAILRLTRQVREKFINLRSQPPEEKARGEKGFWAAESY